MTVATYDGQDPLLHGSCRRGWSYQLVRLLEGWLLNMQPISSNVRQSSIVEHDNRVGVLRQPSQGENTVVGMDDDIASVGRVRKD